MIHDALTHTPDREIYLFYGNQKQCDAPFLKELESLQTKHPQFKLVATMADDPTWQGESGFINDVMVKKYITDLSLPVFYVCGSPAMVTALQEILAELNIDEQNIKTEDFPGY
jgi:ferredoxin-NADP reductase